MLLNNIEMSKIEIQKKIGIVDDPNYICEISGCVYSRTDNKVYLINDNESKGNLLIYDYSEDKNELTNGKKIDNPILDSTMKLEDIDIVDIDVDKNIYQIFTSTSMNSENKDFCKVLSFKHKPGQSYDKLYIKQIGYSNIRNTILKKGNYDDIALEGMTIINDKLIYGIRHVKKHTNKKNNDDNPDVFLTRLAIFDMNNDRSKIFSDECTFVDLKINGIENYPNVGISSLNYDPLSKILYVLGSVETVDVLHTKYDQTNINIKIEAKKAKTYLWRFAVDIVNKEKINFIALDNIPIFSTDSYNTLESAASNKCINNSDKTLNCDNGHKGEGVCVISNNIYGSTKLLVVCDDDKMYYYDNSYKKNSFVYYIVTVPNNILYR